ncbi:MAG: hypothetical protein H8E31_10480 [Planctomycetes bacterium]|nr:hypothetical protein [Planctomycetota bacterium]
MTKRQVQVRVNRLGDQGKEDDLRDSSPAELLAMVWEITRDVWAFVPNQNAESRLLRHVVRVVRRGG